MEGNRLVIGLDYGTTFTGVSYCEASNTATHSEHIEVIHDWPSKHTTIGTKEKVPSEVTYGNEGIVWGALIASDTPRHMWTKLQLDSRQVGEAAKIIRETSSSQQLDKKPTDVVADFLGQVKTHLIKNLDQKYGRALWRTLPITLVVTVPAVWSDLAKARTLEAVDKAGFNGLEFPQSMNTIITTEPESAAIYTIQALKGPTQDMNFAIGDGFIVCDMGGGTVDLISYRVSGLNPTTIEEATVGSGAECGGSFVDRAFLQWLERRLGTDAFVSIAGCRAEEVPRTSLAKKAARLLQAFRYEAKGGFSGTETNFLQLPYPLSNMEDEAKGIHEGDIMISPDDMEGMFEKSIRCTYELITEQLQQARKSKKVNIKYIFLVGGFSESPYIYNKIEAFVKNMDLIAIKPAYAWSAVARGAATKGLEAGSNVTIKNRKCRRHYGTSCNQYFSRSKHRESDSYICEFTGEKRANNQVRWLLERGQELSTTEVPHSKLPFSRNFWPHQARSQELTLLATDARKAPRRSKDKEVYLVAKLKVDLTDVPEQEFLDKCSPDGRYYQTLDYEIEISVQSALEFSVS